LRLGETLDCCVVLVEEEEEEEKDIKVQPEM
jgi:hypothetical protein